MTEAILEKIKNTRARVVENQKINDELYQKLIDDLELEECSPTEEILFDVVFNAADEKHFLDRFKN